MGSKSKVLHNEKINGLRCVQILFPEWDETSGGINEEEGYVSKREFARARARSRVDKMRTRNLVHRKHTYTQTYRQQ